MALAIAIYAAVVATGALVWQIYAWNHSRKLHLQVLVRRGASDNFGATVRIIAVNRSSYPVRVTAVGFDDPRGPALQTSWTEQWPESSLPGVVPPHDSRQAAIPLPDLPPNLLGARVIAWVTTSTGDQVRSSPTNL
jgi:hypothetical protein